ncbi:MAG: DMT family transporter [Candidatus Wolfebacteria bacterium]|nr:DMT family transporter [Candidatus Wolfebacteria bacterium]
MGNKNFRYATILALTTAFISGLSNFINKTAVTAVKDPILFTVLKNSLVAILLIGVLTGLKKWPEIKSLTKNQCLKLILIGIIGGSIPFALFFTGLSKTSAVNAALIHKTLFLWVFVLAIPFLKERMNRWQWLGVATIFAANLFVGGFTGFKYNTGEFMILGATFFWAIENIIAKKTLEDVSSSVVSAARMAIGSLILIIFLFSRGDTLLLPNMNPAQWGWIFLTSALLFGYVTTWYTALKHAPATYVATLLVPATLVTNVLSAIFITHAFTFKDLLSSVLFVCGTFLIIVFAKKTFESPNLAGNKDLSSVGA